MRKNIDNLMSHCVRVTAAVALQKAGVSIDEIAFVYGGQAQRSY